MPFVLTADLPSAATNFDMLTCGFDSNFQRRFSFVHSLSSFHLDVFLKNETTVIVWFNINVTFFIQPYGLLFPWSR
jgi:hypothetical protein